MKKEFKTLVTKNDDSTADILVTIEKADFSVFKNEALKKIVAIAEIDGFRKGHAPEKIVLEKYGQMAVLEEMANSAIDDTFAEALKVTALDAIGSPEISVTKLAADNEFEYKINVALLPDLQLPDYAKIAKDIKKEKSEVTQDEVDDVLLELRRMRAHKELHDDGSRHGQQHDHKDEAHDKEHESIKDKKDQDLPALDDEYVAALGEFKTVAELTEKVRENLSLEKSQKDLEKRRNQILEAIEKETKGVIPSILIDSETERMLAQMKGDVAQMGGTFSDYLGYIKKTESDLKKEWRADGEKRAKIQLILNKIAKERNVKPDEKILELEVTRLMEAYKEADKERATDYMYQMLLNEAVLKSIEG